MLAEAARLSVTRENWFRQSHGKDHASVLARPPKSMMTTVFQRVGPYEILEEIGRGGMAAVFLATDTRSRARGAETGAHGPRSGSARNPRGGAKGAKLQEQFCRVSAHVPVVYEHGTEWGYFYIAMEYLEDGTSPRSSQVVR